MDAHFEEKEVKVDPEELNGEPSDTEKQSS